jgi:DNA mismatch endonuclease, patch repair protein
MDALPTADRTRNMSAIRSTGMKHEMAVRRMAFWMGYRFRLHQGDLPGKPDLVFPSRRAVIFVHGCFWHQHPSRRCKIVRTPESNLDYWRPKLLRNAERDKSNRRKLRSLSWRVLVAWECSLADETPKVQFLKLRTSHASLTDDYDNYTSTEGIYAPWSALEAPALRRSGGTRGTQSPPRRALSNPRPARTLGVPALKLLRHARPGPLVILAQRDVACSAVMRSIWPGAGPRPVGSIHTVAGSPQ